MQKRTPRARLLNTLSGTTDWMPAMNDDKEKLRVAEERNFRSLRRQERLIELVESRATTLGALICFSLTCSMLTGLDVLEGPGDAVRFVRVSLWLFSMVFLTFSVFVCVGLHNEARCTRWDSDEITEAPQERVDRNAVNR